MTYRLFRKYTKKDGTVVEYRYNTENTNKDRPYYKKARAAAAARYKKRKTTEKYKPDSAAKPCIYCKKTNRAEIDECRQWVDCDYRRMR